MAQINEPSGTRLFPADDVNALASGQGYSTADNVTAAGTTRATGTQLQYQALTNIGTAAASTGVVLPSAQPGARMEIANSGANTVQVYALGSDTISATAGATGISVSANKAITVFCTAATKWLAVVGA